MNHPLNNIKSPLPCMHVWKFVQNSDQFGDEAYFECERCHRQAFYDPAELADYEMELTEE